MYHTDINEDGNVLHWDHEGERAYLAPINKGERND